MRTPAKHLHSHISRFAQFLNPSFHRRIVAEYGPRLEVNKKSRSDLELLGPVMDVGVGLDLSSQGGEIVKAAEIRSKIVYPYPQRIEYDFFADHGGTMEQPGDYRVDTTANGWLLTILDWDFIARSIPVSSNGVPALGSHK